VGCGSNWPNWLALLQLPLWPGIYADNQQDSVQLAPHRSANDQHKRVQAVPVGKP
jgi:hypothetical protein